MPIHKLMLSLSKGADFARIRQFKLGRFTIDRLMTILDRLGCEVRLEVSVVKRAA